MKKLIALIAVLSFGPYANAADGADFTHSGDFRLQYTNNKNIDFNEDAGVGTDQGFKQRLRWGTDVKAGEKLTGKFMLVHNADWGRNSDQVPDTTTFDSAAATHNLLIVNEANATWMASDAWSIKFGRGTVTLADGRFVSANDYFAVAKAFDGLMASWDQELMRLSFFGVVGAEGTDATDANDFGRFFGVTADFKTLPEFLKAAHIHVVQVKRDSGEYWLKSLGAQNLGKQDNMKIGVMVSGEVAGLDWRLNYEMEDGEDTAFGSTTKTDISTSMMDAELGYSLPDMMNSRFHFGYHMDSGTSSGTDDETYDGFHYDKHYNAGLMDYLAWGNLTYMRIGAKMMPSDDITVGLEYLMFTQTEKEDGYMTVSSSLESAGDPTKDELGDELDLWISKKYSNNFSIMARYGMFMPGDEFGSDADDYTQMYLEGKLTF